jgi:hypothetical protein
MLINARAALIHLQMHCNVGSRVLARCLALHVDELLACKVDGAGRAGVVVDNKFTIRPFVYDKSPGRDKARTMALV